MSEFSFDKISNGYGTLNVLEQNGKFFWSVDNNNLMKFQEIPRKLYIELVNFYNSQNELEDENIILPIKHYNVLYKFYKNILCVGENANMSDEEFIIF